MRGRNLRERLAAALIDVAKDAATGIVLVVAFLLLVLALIEGLALIFRIG